MRLSFICPSNNPQMFNDNIVASLDRQKNRDFELILVDTQKEHYSSAATALNAGAARATGEYFVFLHHDIVLESEDFIDELLKMIESCDFIVAGVAGAIRYDWPRLYRVRSNIEHGVSGSRRVPGKTAFTEIAPMESLDECFFIIPAEVFKKRGFYEFMPTWHLYAVEYCLWAYDQGIDNPVLLFPVRLWHQSAGNSLDKSYFTALRRLRKIYRRDIICTVGAWPINPIGFEYRVLRRKIHLVRMHIRKFRKKWRKYRAEHAPQKTRT